MSQSGPNLSPIGLKPLQIESDGILGQIPDGSILNFGGTTYPTFTVDGKSLLFADGTSTGPGGGGIGITLQTTYNNSPNVGGQAGITLQAGKDFVINDPFNDGNYFTIAAANGQVTINGNLVVHGSSTTIDTIIQVSDHLKISPANGTISPLIIEPQLGIIPISDLITVKRTFGSQPVFRIDAAGNLIATKNLTISGTINGIDIVSLNNEVQNHHNGVAPERHMAADVDISPIVNLPGASNVQQALQALSINTGNPGGTVFGYEHTQTIPSAIWTIIHNRHTLRAQVTIYDIHFEQIIPESVKIIDADTIQVAFGGNYDAQGHLIGSMMAGSAMVILF